MYLGERSSHQCFQVNETWELVWISGTWFLKQPYILSFLCELGNIQMDHMSKLFKKQTH